MSSSGRFRVILCWLALLLARVAENAGKLAIDPRPRIYQLTPAATS